MGIPLLAVVGRSVRWFTGGDTDSPRAPSRLGSAAAITKEVDDVSGAAKATITNTSSRRWAGVSINDVVV